MSALLLLKESTLSIRFPAHEQLRDQRLNLLPRLPRRQLRQRVNPINHLIQSTAEKSSVSGVMPIAKTPRNIAYQRKN